MFFKYPSLLIPQNIPPALALSILLPLAPIRIIEDNAYTLLLWKNVIIRTVFNEFLCKDAIPSYWPANS